MPVQNYAGIKCTGSGGLSIKGINQIFLKPIQPEKIRKMFEIR